MAQTPKITDTPEASKLLNNPQRLKELLGAPETKRLMELLAQGNGAQLKQAAVQAKQGNSAALSQMLRQLSQSGDGAQVLNQLQSKIEK